jgi:hypothetical protein
MENFDLLYSTHREHLPNLTNLTAALSAPLSGYQPLSSVKSQSPSFEVVADKAQNLKSLTIFSYDVTSLAFSLFGLCHLTYLSIDNFSLSDVFLEHFSTLTSLEELKWDYVLLESSNSMCHLVGAFSQIRICRFECGGLLFEFSAQCLERFINETNLRFIRIFYNVDMCDVKLLLDRVSEQLILPSFCSWDDLQKECIYFKE